MTSSRSSLARSGAASNYRALTQAELATRLAAVVDSSADAIIAVNQQGDIETWNSAATRTFGYSAEEMLGQSFLLLVPPERHEEEFALLERTWQGERVQQHEAEWLCKGGERIAVSANISPIWDHNNQVIGSALTARSIGEQQREHADRARLAAIVESSEDAIVAKDLNGVVTNWNAAAERMFGFTTSEMVGRSILTIVPPELQQEEPMLISEIRSGVRIQHHETERLHKSGRRLAVSLSLSPIRNSYGNVVGASSIIRDITDQRRMEMSRLMLAAIVESSDDAIISKNLDGVITSWNASAQRLFGYKPEEMIGQSVLRLIPRELHSQEPQIIAKLKRGERIQHFETKRLRKDGRQIDISLTVSPIKDASGKVIGASKIVRDISDKKAAEAALIEKEKLAATGRLAATLAHEVNNPLEAITNLAYLLSNYQELDPTARNYATMLLTQVQRAGEITRKTLSYYRDSRMIGEVDIPATIQDILRWSQARLESKKVKLETSFDSAGFIVGCPGEIRQVLENLIENALDALHVGGSLKIRVRNTGVKNSESVAVSICDNGDGIPQDVRTRIFEPFFTTKLESGNGLGLWVSKALVRKHNGTIAVRSSTDALNHGTVFRVSLPMKSL